jgi:NaMN:DMB phosphoribosyltransferase
VFEQAAADNFHVLQFASAIETYPIHPQAFATIKSTTGISDIEEIATWLR